MSALGSSIAPRGPSTQAAAAKNVTIGEVKQGRGS
jgi:hypothetical protein